jgi:hypothetical protein
MFITKSEKQSLVETSLNLGDKVLKLEAELNAIKAILKRSPSWKWVENLDKRIVQLEKKPVVKNPLSVVAEKPTIAPIVVSRKIGRPLGSKSVAPKFPPKTPFELKKPLGRPKGSKNKPK